MLRSTGWIVPAGIAATLAPGPRVAQAQPRGAIRRIGVLMTNRASDPAGQSYATTLVPGLGSLGWKDGGNLRIDWRWAGGDPTLFERCATELVALGPEVVVTFGSAVEALPRQTSTIPIVFTQATDPVGQGCVASPARPGGNVTGFSMFDPPTRRSLHWRDHPSFVLAVNRKPDGRPRRLHRLARKSPSTDNQLDCLGFALD